MKRSSIFARSRSNLAWAAVVGLLVFSGLLYGGAAQASRSVMQGLRPHPIPARPQLGGRGKAATFAVRALTSITVTTTVNTLAADGQCSLREAIINANNDAATHADCVAGSGADTIVLAAGANYVLAAYDNTEYGFNGLPAITSALTIDGNGAVITRSGSAPLRLFYVANTGNLTLQNLTLSNGLAKGGNGGSGLSGGGGGGAGLGGAILNRGALTLSNCLLNGNKAQGGNGGLGNGAYGNATAGAGGGGLGGNGGNNNYSGGGTGGGGFGGNGGDNPCSSGTNSKGGSGGGGTLTNGGGSCSTTGGAGGVANGGAGGNQRFPGNNGGVGGGGGGGGAIAATGDNPRGGNGGIGGGGGGGGTSQSTTGNGNGGTGGFGGGGGGGGLRGATTGSSGGAGGGGGFGGGGGGGGQGATALLGGNGPGGSGGFGGGNGATSHLTYGSGGGGGGGLGGAIFNDAGGTLALSNCSLSANTAQGGNGGNGSMGTGQPNFPGSRGGNGGSGYGGAIFNYNGLVTLTTCVFPSNAVTAGPGGTGGIGNGSAGDKNGCAVYNLQQSGGTAIVNLINTTPVDGPGCSAILNNGGTVTTPPPCTPPAMVTDPLAQTVCVGSNPVFSAAANGTPSPTVQWQVSTDGGANFTSVPGATAAALQLNNVTPALNGNRYRAVFTNVCGTATSAAAALAIEIAPPVISCPNNLTQNTAADACTAVVNYAAPPATDNCGVVAVHCAPASGATFPLGTTTVTCNATDTAGNTASCSFTVTVNDAQAPTLVNCPTSITQTTDADTCNAVVNYTTPTATDNCGTAAVTCTPASGSTFAKGVTTVNCTTTDVAGNPANCAFTVTINDAQAPTLSAGPGNLTQNTDPDACTAVVNYSAPTATDNCGSASVTCAPASGSTFNKGVTAVTCTATDGTNTASLSFNVTVSDAQAPTLANCPASLTQVTDANACTAVVNYSVPAVSDNCAGATVSCVPASGSAFAKGATTVTCTATDAAGNVASCAFTVTVNDAQAPSLSAGPGNLAQNTDANVCTAVVNYTTPAVSDNCAGATILCVPASGSTFNKGMTTVNCTATDGSGNTASLSFSVTVNDAQPPTLATCPANQTVAATSAAGAVVNYSAPAATDNCGTAAVTCAPAAGATFAVGTTAVTCTATDAANNASACSFTVTVTPLTTGSCVSGHGYWKNHAAAWPVNTLVLGSQTYNQTELLALLGAPVKGDASIILAHQHIAAKLNLANGAGAATIAATVQAADQWLSQFSGKLPYNVKPSTTQGQAAVNLAGTLERYNTGTLAGGPLACADHTPVQARRAVANDFDGDGRSDPATWRAADGRWLLAYSSGGVNEERWGDKGDLPVAADYDGDGQTDLAVWRPADGGWYILHAGTGVIVTQKWGVAGDVPAPGDYDGDGKADLAVWRPGDGTWYVRRSSDGGDTVEAWGQPGDLGVPGDYDGDGKADLAVWRPGSGVWYVQRSSGGTQVTAWGAGYAPYFDVPVAADYDGDGKTDLAIWRGADSLWHIRKSSDGQPLVQRWGAKYAPYHDVPVPGDYDGDGKADIAVWRPANGTWYALRSTDGTYLIRARGQAGDAPVSSHAGHADHAGHAGR